MLTLLIALQATIQMPAEMRKWKPNDEKRPVPPIVAPGKLSTSVPNGAKALFDGKTLGNWVSVKGGPAKWRVVNGTIEVEPNTGDIQTREKFGDCQLHIEWRTPTPATGSGQKRGNSGVWLQGLYEVQILDSYRNKTYADGQAGAIYAQYPPRVNASKPPGEWQAFDIYFYRPRWSGNKLTNPARMTVFHNGVLIHDNVKLVGPSAYMSRPPYSKTDERLPLKLQDHGDKVRFRNIWLKDL